MITLDQALRIGKRLNVNFDAVSVHTLKKGMNVELEHGRENRLTNITDNNLVLTAKIALAHITEFPDYYERLEKMEQSAEKYWKNRRKPNAFIK
jgi:hypothetical protein